MVGTGDDLGGAYVRACRDIEEITAFVEQDKVALHFADVLAQDHDAIHTFTARGLVVELGHVFVVEDQVGVGPFADDALFLVGLIALPLLVGHGVITGFALQGLPLCLVEGLSTGTHRRVGVHPEDEVDAFGPSIKMSVKEKSVSPRTQRRLAWGCTSAKAASIQGAAPVWLGTFPGRLTRKSTSFVLASEITSGW